jgi:Ca2+-binding RTX toxin-like protein
MSLYGPNSSTNLVAFNNNISSTNLFSEIKLTGNQALAPGKYYIEIDDNGENNAIPQYTLGALAWAPGTPEPSFFATLASSGILYVVGTPNDDTIDLNLSAGNNVSVDVNGQTLYFPLSSITAIDAGAGKGNDTVSIGAGLPEATVRGGLGDDQITTANGADDSLNGGPGNDTLTGGPGNDTIFGGQGNDSITATGGADNLLRGGLGDDTIQGGGVVGDTIFGGGPGNDYIVADVTSIIVSGGGNDTIIGGIGS